MSFTQFNFSSQIVTNIRNCGYEQPTPIQEKAIPKVLSGSDLLGLAQTGTGKTAAFALPIIQRLSKGPRGKVRALVVAPTRELAEQINQSFLDLSVGTGLRTVTVYGGVGKGNQLQQFKRGVEVVVACPGRLLDHLNSQDLNLNKVDILVLDEADQMFDMGFFPDIRRILKYLPKHRQTLLFSATMPEDIRKLADETLTHPEEVRINLEQPLNLISQVLHPVTKPQKTALLLHLLKETNDGSTLVFTRTKYGAKKLAKKLVTTGYKATDLQGNMSQNQRQRALTGFRDGDFTILVATDIAARGIDVSLVGQVINFDLPSTAEAYTHRIGRTGRAQRSGRAVSFVCHDDQPMVKAIERLQGKSIERLTITGFAMDAEADQLEAPRKQTPRRSTRKKTIAAPRSGQQTRSGGKEKSNKPKSKPRRAGNIFGLGSGNK
ncbi:MAG: DEAD/DEAH box helicase [Proteobacteria bacterium]|nr:DEAD/DEAH box helicase [Pseudomonadota bacterium]MBU1059415.1 DEAD/DEAH box helicase [Pseudomonadota bacterium]